MAKREKVKGTGRRGAERFHPLRREDACKSDGGQALRGCSTGGKGRTGQDVPNRLSF